MKRHRIAEQVSLVLQNDAGLGIYDAAALLGMRSQDIFYIFIGQTKHVSSLPNIALGSGE